MKITLLEPFFTGSHAAWATAYAKYSEHQVDILKLGGRYWKWRMHGGAISLARKFLEQEQETDLLLATDMLDLTTFLALTRSKSRTLPTAIYFHENQLTYPWSPLDGDVELQRDKHYNFINYISALSADAVFFNSSYHRDSFLAALPPFLNTFPDHREKQNVDIIAKKSQVLYLGLDLLKFDAFQDQSPNEKPLILWNHRWEYDKDPSLFFEILYALDEAGLDFEVAILGEKFKKYPAVFDEAKDKLKEKIVQWGFVENFEDYAKWLWKADILPVTADQDFFGGSVVEAMYCGTYPILPQRLAYPEHIPIDYHQHHFFKSKKQLFERLKWSIEQIDMIRKLNIQSFVSQYDWQQKMAKIYDHTFDQLV